MAGVGSQLAGGIAGFLATEGLDPSDPYARAAETFPRLTDEQVERVAAFGAVEPLPGGTSLFERDDRGVDFFLVLEGFIEIFEQGPGGEPVVMTVHAEHQFTDKGFIRTGTGQDSGTLMETSRPGIFAVGDVRAGSVKRFASGVGEGSVVVSSVHHALAAPRPGS